MPRDSMTIADEVYANVSSDGVVPVILNPCEKCGRQAVEHTPCPTTGKARMICCFDDCRHIVDGVPKR